MLKRSILNIQHLIIQFPWIQNCRYTTGALLPYLEYGGSYYGQAGDVPSVYSGGGPSGRGVPGEGPLGYNPSRGSGIGPPDEGDPGPLRPSDGGDRGLQGPPGFLEVEASETVWTFRPTWTSGTL